MVRILVLNDLHLAGTPPRSCREAYTEDLFNALEELKELVHRAQIEVTVCTGDTFHEKRSAPHWLVERTIRLFKDWPGQKLWIAGNHDLGAGGLPELSRQPLGVLIASGVVEFLERDRVDAYGDVIIQWSPANYTDDIDEHPERLAVERHPEADYVVKVVHASLFPPRQPAPFPIIPYDAVPVSGIDAVLRGHIHHDHGALTVNGCVFVAYGSLGRVAKEPENVRIPRVAILEVERTGIAVRSYRLKSMLKPEDLFVEALVERMSFSTDEYLESLQQLSIDGEFSLQEAVALLKNEYDSAILQRVRSFLEEAGAR
jgi:hypothetical protein